MRTALLRLGGCRSSSNFVVFSVWESQNLATMIYEITLPRIVSSYSWLFLPLCMSIDISAAVSIQSRQSLTLPVNLTSTTTALNTTSEHWSCNRQAEFITDSFDGNDCLTAIDKLYRTEVSGQKKQIYEFRDLPSFHVYPYPTQSVPRKYVTGKLKKDPRVCHPP